GSAAVQLATARGVEVWATAGSETKGELCRKLGATRAINHRSRDFVEVVVANGRVDMVLDIVGGAYLEKNLRCLREGGRLVSIGFMQGSRAEIDLIPVLKRNLTITGSMLRPQSALVKQ